LDATPSAPAQTAPIPEIPLAELSLRLRDPALAIVNVLPREAFLEGRIPGSVSLPVADIPARARQVLADPAQELAVYCASPT
jgi:rhodanese-related sulfurtransferase